MEIFQTILVLIAFTIAVGFLVTKFVWKPAFLGGKKKSEKGCGSDCGCH